METAWAVDPLWATTRKVRFLASPPGDCVDSLRDADAFLDLRRLARRRAIPHHNSTNGQLRSPLTTLSLQIAPSPRRFNRMPSSLVVLESRERDARIGPSRQNSDYRSI